MKSSSIPVVAPSPDLLWAAIIDSSDDAIMSQDLDGIITSWNRGAERIFGYSAEEIVGQSVTLLIPPDRLGEEPGILAQLKRGERVEHFETVRVAKDGRRIEISLTVSPIRDASGQVIGACKIVRDIGERMHASRASSLLSAIVDSSDDAIVSKSLNGIITSWNKAAERIFGYTAEEIVGRPVTLLIPKDRLDEEPRIIERLKRGERVDHFETVRVRKDGTKIDLSLTISPVKDHNGVIVGASKVARDISLQVRAQRELGRANDELKRADRVKTEFLAVMSHELRTPLNSILGFTGVVLRRLAGPLTEEQEKQLRMVHGSATHLLHLINDVLDLSRIESGRVEIHAEKFLPAETLARAVKTIEVTARQKGIDLISDLPALPEMCGDEQKFLQILLNLLGNAVKFTPEGRVTLTARETGGMLVTSITDTGIGIPADKQGMLFQPFRQVEGSSRRRFEGTGLGLYLCKKLVTLMGGQIALTSAPGHGSTFTFSLPVAIEARTVSLENVAVPA